MKKLALITGICLIAWPAFAQVEFGVKAGMNLTNISADMLAGDYQITSNPGSKVGYHAGGMIRASLFGIFIQPELVFTSVASEFMLTDQNTMIEQIAKQRVGRVDVPLIVGAKLGNLHLGLGPVASIIVSDKSDLTKVTGYKTTMKSATIGYQLGLGLDFWKMGFDVRYEGNLSNLGDQIDIGGQTMNFDTRARQVILSLSYRF